MVDCRVGLIGKQHVQVFNEITSNFGMEDSNGVDGNGRNHSPQTQTSFSNLGHVGDIVDQILRAIVEEVEEEAIPEVDVEEDENEENLLNE